MLRVPYWMKFSSSLLVALIGGVTGFFSDDPPLVAKNVPPNMVERVAIASYRTVSSWSWRDTYCAT